MQQHCESAPEVALGPITTCAVPARRRLARSPQALVLNGGTGGWWGGATEEPDGIDGEMWDPNDGVGYLAVGDQAQSPRQRKHIIFGLIFGLLVVGGSNWSARQSA